MTTIAPPICAVCVHLVGDLLDPKCAAFPDGIPSPILLSQADHRQAYSGDHGIQFQPEDARAAQYAAFLFEAPGNRIQSTTVFR
jgi:hypothetical protein